MVDRVSIYPSYLKGVIRVPSSKSQTMRALLFSLLARGRSVIDRPLYSSDVEAMIEACRLLGASVDKREGWLEVEGRGISAAEDVIDARNSGQVARFIGAVAALAPHHSVVTGDFSIRHRRVMTPLLEGLSQLGAHAFSSRGDGGAPIVIKGPLKGGKASIDGTDSQPVSALLIASAFSPLGAELKVVNPSEIAWIDLTLSWFDRLAIRYEHVQYGHYWIRGAEKIGGFEYRVSGDWSSAAYPLAAALITRSSLLIEGVDMEDEQGDKALFFLLRDRGAIQMEVDRGGSTVAIMATGELEGGVIDLAPFIDAITLLAVIGCYSKGRTELVGGRSARYKESDRIRAISTELRKMGAEIEEKEEGLLIYGGPLRGALLDSHADHRVAMSLAVAALGAEGSSSISGVGVVSKSFPDFFDQFRKLGAHIDEE